MNHSSPSRLFSVRLYRFFQLPQELPLPRTLDGILFVALLLACSLLLALQPLSLDLPPLAVRFFYSATALAVTLGGIWALVLFLKSRVAWNWFFAPVLVNLALALLVGLLSRILSQFAATALGLPALQTVVFSLTPLLSVIVLGWTVQKHGQLPERQSEWLGWAAVALMSGALAVVDFLAVVH